MHERPIQKHLVRVLLLSSIILFVGGGVALLNSWQQGPIPSHASDDNVVGPPSLPASFVDSIFRRLGSPMVGTGQAVETAARAQNIDDAFALAVWWTETNDGAAGVGLHDRNPGSVRGSVGYPSAFDGYTIYPSFSAAVTYWFGMLHKVYISRGLTTVYAISHPYVGTSTSNLWAGKVITLMNRYRAEAPPPPATPPVSNTPAASTVNANLAFTRHAKAFWQQDQNQGSVSLQSTPQNLAVSTPSASSSGLSNNLKMLLVFFNLLATLGLGLVANNMRKRHASSTQLASLLGNSLQAKVRTGFQQSAALWPAFPSTEAWRTTEDLKWPAPMTGALAMTTSTLPTSSSDALLSLSVFMATQPQEAVYTPQIHNEQWSPLHTPVPDYSQVPRLSGLGLPSRPMQPSGAPLSNSLHRTRLLPSRPTASQWAPVVAEATPDKLPQLVGVGASSGRANGLLSRYREAQGEQ